VDLAPGMHVLRELMARERATEAALKQRLREVLPQRLAGSWLRQAAEGWSNAALEECERGLHRWAFHPVRTEGLRRPR